MLLPSRDASSPRRRTLLIVACALFAGVPRANGAETWRDRLDLAQQLSKKGKNAEAVAEARGALADADKALGSSQPETGEVLARVSSIYEAADDAERLGEMESRLGALQPKTFETWLAWGRLLRLQEKFRAAEAPLRKALALRPDDFDAVRELAILDQDMGRDEEAANLFRRAIKSSPEDRALYHQLARSELILGHSASAKEAFSRAQKLEGASVDAYVNAGYFHLDSGDVAQAEDAFRRAIAVDTASAVGYHHMGSFLAEQGRYAEAEKFFRRALERLDADPKAKADDLVHTLGWLGDVLQKQGRLAESEAVLSRCLNADVSRSAHALTTNFHPDPNVLCLRSLSAAYASEGKITAAEAVLERAAGGCGAGGSCTCRGLALVGLAHFHLQQGRAREASAEADEADRSCRDYRSSNVSVLQDLAGLYFRLGDSSKADALHARVKGRLRHDARPVPFPAGSRN